MRSLAAKLFLSRAFVILCRLVLAAVFIYAAVGKIRNAEEFAELVKGYRLLPIFAVNIVAIILPWFELLCGISLIIGILVRSAGLAVAALNLAFASMVLSAMARGLDIECGCFTLSKAHSKVGWVHVGMNLLLFLISLLVVFGARGRERAGSD